MKPARTCRFPASPAAAIKAVTVTTDMPTLLKAAIEQNFVPVVDDRNVFIGMVRRTVLLRELYDKYTTLPTDKRFKGSHPPM